MPFGPRITTKVSRRNVNVTASLQVMKGVYVTVGIPPEKSQRSGDHEKTNADLLFIHSKGSPLAGIPPRPVIEPAIEDPETKPLIAEALRRAAVAILMESYGSARWWLNTAGRIGRDAAKAWFFNPDNNWMPLATGEERTPLIWTGQMRNAISYTVTATFPAKGASSNVRSEVGEAAEAEEAVLML
jgi:hypothetical protein